MTKLTGTGTDAARLESASLHSASNNVTCGREEATKNALVFEKAMHEKKHQPENAGRQNAGHAGENPAMTNEEKSARNRQQDRQEGHPGEGKDADNTGENDLFSMSSLFAGRFGTAPGTAETGGTGQAAPAGALVDEQPLATALVEQILVSRPEDGMQEVRLTLNSAILADTHVAVSRDAGGNLFVHITSGNASSLQALIGAQDNLRAALAAKESGLVRVDVQNRTDAENGDMRRQSRGLIEEDGIPHDK